MKITGADGDKVVPRGGLPSKVKGVSGKAPGASDAKRASAGRSDKVDISAKARDISRAREVAVKAPDIRPSKVDALKKALSDGTYKVDAAKLAEKILKEEIDL